MTHLETLIRKRKKLVVGLMSGTSVDSIDAVLVSITGSGTSSRFKQIAFHIIRPSNGSSDVSDETLQGMLTVLNDGFKTITPFRFLMYRIDRTDNSDWISSVYGSTEDLEMRSHLAIQPQNVINIYICIGARVSATDPITYYGLSALPDMFDEDEEYY